MSVDVKLTPDFLQVAYQEAARRQSDNEAKGRIGRNRAPSTGDKALELHRLGCIGELVVATHLDMREHVFGDDVPVRNSPDLPGKIEVRTRSKHSYDLLVQFNDDPNKSYVLVTYQGDGLAKIVGWIAGKDAMKKEWIREFVRGRPCYAVPQDALSPISSLEVNSKEKEPAGRLLTSHEAWLSEEPKGTGKETDLVLNFSKELSEALGWYPGDSLAWDIDQSSGTCRIYKKQ